MKSQIYTHQSVREIHIRQIDEFVWPFYNKIIPQFENIEAEAEMASNDYWHAIGENYSDGDDIGNYVDDARDYGFSHYNMMNLGLYTATLAWHATLFEFFHQQIRLFLFKELSHCFPIESNKFCEKFSDVKLMFKDHNFDIGSLASWPKLIELQTLCNAIKHGDGDSLQKLRKMAPEKFKKSHGTDLFELYKTTLLEITLDLGSETLKEYVNAITDFWNGLPERCFSNELE